MNAFLSYIAVLMVIGIHLIGEEFSDHIERYHPVLLSLGAGLMVGTFFLEILPQVVLGDQYVGELVYIVFCGGFVFTHVVEKLVFKHATDEKELVKDTILFEASGLIAYYILIGLLIPIFIDTYGANTILVLFPFFVRSFAITVYAKHINEGLENKMNRVLQTLSPMVGSVIGLYLITNKIILYLVFSSVMGLILYVLVRDMIPKGREGKPIHFFIGAFIMIILSFLTISN